MSTGVTAFVAAHGVLAIFALMAVDAILPAGSELAMLYAGALGVGAFGTPVLLFGTTLPTGAVSVAVLILAGTLGYLVGALAGWAIGMRGGRPLLERHGRWLHLGPERLARAERWFERFGTWAVFLGRITPVVRSFVSIPAGVLGSPLPSYTALTFAGSLLWCTVFGLAGAALGSNYEQVHRAMGHIEEVAAVLVVVALAALVVRARRARASKPSPSTTSSGGTT